MLYTKCVSAQRTAANPCKLAQSMQGDNDHETQGRVHHMFTSMLHQVGPSNSCLRSLRMRRKPFTFSTIPWLIHVEISCACTPSYLASISSGVSPDTPSTSRTPSWTVHYTNGNVSHERVVTGACNEVQSWEVQLLLREIPLLQPCTSRSTAAPVNGHLYRNARAASHCYIIETTYKKMQEDKSAL